jgi:hypothetical protein
VLRALSAYHGAQPAPPAGRPAGRLYQLGGSLAARAGLAEGELQNRIDSSLLGSVSLLQAHADNQRDLMLATEKSLNDMHKRMLSQLEQSGNHPHSR